MSILIPVYNEANSIRAVLQEVVTAAAAYFRDQTVAVELIVVDDGSDDGSAEHVRAFAIENPGVSLRLIRHEFNAGKGAALRTGIAHADSEFCVVHDADLEYDPGDYPKLLMPLFAGDADVVLSSRCRPLSFWQAAANRAISTFAGMVAGIELPDVETSCKAFRTSLAKSLPLRSNRFGLEPELIIQFAKRHARFIELPVTYRGQTREQRKKIDAREVCFALGNILRAWLFGAGHRDVAADMLVALSQAKRFNRWMADTVRPWISGEVLEFGAGIGNLTVLLSDRGNPYTATDTDKEHLFELRSRIAYRTNVKLDICDFSNVLDVARFKQSADTVICMNVLEHVTEDVAGLTNIHACLRPGGTAIVLVPQSPELFGSLDEVLDHKRRYTKEELTRKMIASGFRMKQLIEFNHATWPGWYFNSRLLRRRTLSRVQLRLFDFMVPLWRSIDNRLPWPGTSLIAIGIVAAHDTSE